MHPVRHHALTPQPRDEPTHNLASSLVGLDEPPHLHAPSFLDFTHPRDERTHRPQFVRAALASLSARDRQILALARHHLAGAPCDFTAATRALLAATAELIPAGRVYLVARTSQGPVLGSIVSGVGLVPADDGPHIVRVGHDGRITQLGSFWP